MVELISISMREEKRHLIGVRPGKTKSEDSYEGLQKGAIFGVLFRRSSYSSCNNMARHVRVPGPFYLLICKTVSHVSLVFWADPSGEVFCPCYLLPCGFIRAVSFISLTDTSSPRRIENPAGVCLDSHKGPLRTLILALFSLGCFFDGPGQTSVADEIPLLMAAASSQAAVPDKIPGIMGDYV